MRFKLKVPGFFFGGDVIEHVVEQEGRTGGVPVQQTLKVGQLDQALDDGLGRGRSHLMDEIVRKQGMDHN